METIRVIKKIRKLMTHHQFIRVIELGVIMIIAGFMEMLSVALILPFIEAIISPDEVMENQYVQIVCKIVGLQSHKSFLFFLAIVMAIMYILKNVFLLFQIMVQNRFASNQMFAMQYALLDNYLSRPYEDFLNIKSGDVLQVISVDVSRTYTILTYILSMFAEIVISLSLLISILLISPGITIAMGCVMMFLVILMQAIVKPVLNESGSTNRKANAGMNQWLLQAIQGIKEIKLMKKEEFFKDNFSVYGRKYVKTHYIEMTLVAVPRYMIEAIAMSVFFLVVGITINRGVELESIIPVISGIAMASVRLLPAINRISGNLAAISFGAPAIDSLIENLNTLHLDTKTIFETKRESIDIQKSIIRLNHKLDVSHIRYHYPSSDINVLDDASIVIKKGMSVGVVGSSGSGKTTLIDIILGLLNPQEGSIIADEIDIHQDINGWKSQIGYIPQNIFMIDGTIRSNVAFGVPESGIDDAKVWQALKEASLDDHIKGLPEGLDTEIGERGMRLSGGQRQRIGIARALFLDPEILVFDEATSALDNETEEAIMESIHRLQGKKTMIIIAHRLSTIEGCDAIYKVENGKIMREK